jgi:hypothetical protein
VSSLSVDSSKSNNDRENLSSNLVLASISTCSKDDDGLLQEHVSPLWPHVKVTSISPPRLSPNSRIPAALFLQPLCSWTVSKRLTYTIHNVDPIYMVGGEIIAMVPACPRSSQFCSVACWLQSSPVSQTRQSSGHLLTACLLTGSFRGRIHKAGFFMHRVRVLRNNCCCDFLL